MGKASDRNNIFLADANMREVADHTMDGLRCISYVDEYYNSKYHFHWHDEFEIAYVLSGKIEFHAKDRTYILNEGDGVFINSAVLHNYSSGLEKVLCIFPNVLFSGMVISGADGLLYSKYVEPIQYNSDISYIIFRQSEGGDDEFIRDIKAAFNLLEDMQWGFDLELREVLTRFIVRLYSFLPDSDKNRSANKYLVLSQVAALRKMTAFIKSNISADISVQSIADSAALSVRECQRHFRDYQKTTPIAYLNTLRIDYAKLLLSKTTLTISEICEKCGYSNASYFSKLFRRRTGISPMKYRVGQNTSHL